jgi:hypothetical protein
MTCVVSSELGSCSVFCRFFCWLVGGSAVADDVDGGGRARRLRVVFFLVLGRNSSSTSKSGYSASFLVKKSRNRPI